MIDPPLTRTRPMKNLSFLTVGLAAVALAGCESTTQPPIESDELMPLIGQASGGGGMSRTAICHKRDHQGYILITVATAALSSHLKHGDGGVGDAVPGRAGYVFDESCMPVEVVPPAPTECILAAIEFHDFLSDPDWDFSAYGPWGVGVDQPGDFSISGDGASASVSDLGNGYLQCRVQDDAHGAFAEHVAGGASEFADTRAFLLSLTG